MLAQSERMPLLHTRDYFEWKPGDPLKPIDDENITPEIIVDTEGATIQTINEVYTTNSQDSADELPVLEYPPD